jgi:hypothetical protein
MQRRILRLEFGTLPNRAGPGPNQSPFVERKHVEAAYGQRWIDFSEWVRTMDPNGRMLNPFFAELLSKKAMSSVSAE